MACQLGYLDSNQEMTESESVALPFGDSPMFCNEDDYKRGYTKMQALFLFFMTGRRVRLQAHISGLLSFSLPYRKTARRLTHIWAAMQTFKLPLLS